MSSLSRVAGTIALTAVAAAMLTGCADEGRRRVYDAERLLYRAETMRKRLAGTMVPGRSDFLASTIAEYREIVRRMRDHVGDTEIEVIVIEAQRQIAVLERDAGLLAEARDDYLEVLEIERTLPGVGMNALFNAAVISEELSEWERAYEYHSKFFQDYMSPEGVDTTVTKELNYIEVPVRLASVCRHLDRTGEERIWLQTAESIYLSILDEEPAEPLLEAVRFELLSTYVELAEWDDALRLSRLMTRKYKDDVSRPKLFMIEARVHRIGKQDPQTAGDLYRHVYQYYPESPEAPDAMLGHASLRADAGDPEDAERLYHLVLEQYGKDAGVAAQAEWGIAVIEEARGDWMAASLRYKSIAKRYPGTPAAFDAPLRLAEGYERLGAHDAARVVYERAIDEYKKVARGHYPILTRVKADDYIVRVYIRLERWNDAATHLIATADRYPSFERIRYNYIRAAEIYRDELGDELRCDQTLIACMERFPSSPVAKAAEELLSPFQR